ncbi:MAG TPA: DUF6069 family protein [Chloroflexaceae bacterium]|nr:DUF6069 family protein [Chloroflexaceae bacterium]
MTVTASPAAARAGQTALGRTLLVGLLAGLAAGVANILVYFVAGALGAPLLVPMGGPGAPATPLPILAIVVACTVPAIAAAALYWALGRLTRRATTIFLVVAAAFALLSLGGPLSLPVELSTRLSLSAMHLVAGALIVAGLTRSARQG